MAEILLYDEIGVWGVTAKDFVLALARIGDGPINVRINSPGGDAFDGMAMYNALKGRSAPVIVTVDGIAASAASLVAMAGAEIRMAEASMMMIHNCWGMCVGNRNDMIEMAAVQEKIDAQMAAIYAVRCGKAQVEMGRLMDAETWLTPSEAKQGGFCDAILTGAPASASSGAKILSRAGLRASLNAVSAVLPDYDPDGDGDNDAEEAMGLINSAAVLLGEAVAALSGAENDDGEAEMASMPVVPGASAQKTEESQRIPDEEREILLLRLRLADAEAV